MKGKGILMLILLIGGVNLPIVYLNSVLLSNGQKPIVFTPLGTPGSFASNSCNDESAFQFIGCEGWNVNRPTGGDYKGTIVVMDEALAVDHWKVMETLDTGVDIIRYITYQNGAIKELGSEGVDSLSGVTDSILGYQSHRNHGFAVLSALGFLVPDVKVIFISIKAGNLFAAWNWVRNHVVQYDIDVVSISGHFTNFFNLSPYIQQQIRNSVNDIYRQGAVIISAIGNSGIYEGDTFPVMEKNVWAIASVDHEDRGKWIWSSFYYDPHYYSWKGRYSGYATGIRSGEISCTSTKTLCTSYGVSIPEDAKAVDFSMPGNGVPARFNSANVVYVTGTSISTPYFAAAILAAIYGYNVGYYKTNHRYQDPTPDLLYTILKEVSSTNGNVSQWDYRTGWGYVRLDNAYNQGRSWGRYATCTPMDIFSGKC